MRKQRCVILSPHLDDAVLSCGGLIASLRGKAEVEIWTMFTRGTLRGPYSPTALWLHGATSTPSARRLYLMRREEDRSACRALGAEWRHFNWMDAPYRKDSRGDFLYPADLSGAVHPEDEKLVEAIRKGLKAHLLPDDTILVPFAANSHVDHVIVRRAAQSLTPKTILFYPDLPYAANCADPVDSSGKPLKRVHYSLTKSEIGAWIAAVGCFATQLFLLQNSVGSVDEMIIDYASRGLSLLVGSDGDTIAAARAGLLAALTTVGTPAAGTAAVTDDAIAAGVPLNDDTAVRVRPSRAPIAVFAFRRLDLLQKTLRSLEKCESFSGKEVIVYSDAARPERPDEALAVANVRAWLRGWCHAKGATLVEARRNVGLKASIVSSVSRLLETHERVIVIEDDLILAPSFLTYMNGALEAFKDRDDIVQVSGYMVPHNQQLPPVGLLRAPGSWGWATWRRAWRHYRDDVGALATEVREKDASAFNFDDTYGSLDALDRNASGTLVTWAVRWYASVFLRGGLTLYPSRSLVRNVGFGDDGTNCKPGPMAHVFASQAIARGRVNIDDGAVGSAETPGYAEATKDFYRRQQYQWGKPSFTDRVRGSLQRFASRTG
ncbi:MAG: PIG-L family deacetylase [Gemmatimonadales bacterium]